MGLDYLNKKVWHPGSMKNIQKVWQAQQAQLEIIKRQKQRQKKLLDEKHNEEMKRIQVEAGLIPRSHLERMDWMYDWGNKVQQQKNSQDFLTGQKKPTGKKEVKHIFQEQATNKTCEDFILLHQDPMYAIQKEEMKLRESTMNNPVQMKKIIKEVEEDYLSMHPDSKKKKKSKKHKKQKKEKKKKKHRRHRYSSHQNEQRRRKSRSWSESSNSRSSSGDRSREKKKSKQSSVYQEYLKSRFGGILKKDEDGNLCPDYGMHKKKYKTQIQLDQEERKRRLEKLRGNAARLQQLRGAEASSGFSDKKQEGHINYEEGLANIRKNMLNEQLEKNSDKIRTKIRKNDDDY